MVERRNVVMGPKGKGRICPPWSAEGVRVRVVPCNTAPCPASCVESPLATDSEELVQKANNEFLIFTGIPPAGVSVREAKEIDEGPAEQGNEDKGKGSEVNTAKEDNEKDKDEEEDKETEDSEVKENGDKEEENNEKDKEEEKEDKDKEDSNEKESSNEKDDDSEKAGQAAGEDNEESEASTHSFAAFLNLRQRVYVYIYIRVYTLHINMNTLLYISVYIYFRLRITRQIGSTVISQEIMLAA